MRKPLYLGGMKSEHGTQQCTCQLCVPDWTLVDGEFQVLRTQEVARQDAALEEAARRNEVARLTRLVESRLIGNPAHA